MERVQEEIRICPKKADARFAEVVRAPRDDFNPDVGTTMDCDPDCPGPTVTPREIFGFKLPGLLDLRECPFEAGPTADGLETFDILEGQG